MTGPLFETFQAIAEAIAFGGQLGLSRDLLFDTLAKTAVVAPAHLGKLSTAKRNDYTAQFPLRLMRKDFDLILSKAAELGVEMPTTAAARERNAVEAARSEDEDFSAVIRLMERLTERRSLPSTA
jgi:3-hydroxyisobutyrate dehydrogenase-like beta-hydroxyacid dehydrogenase